MPSLFYKLKNRQLVSVPEHLLTEFGGLRRAAGGVPGGICNGPWTQNYVGTVTGFENQADD